MSASMHDPRAQGATSPLLDVRGLRIFFGQPGREVEATRDVTFSLHPGERVGLVGESGCGKTVTGLSILGLLPPGSSRLEGSIEFDGRNLLTLSPRELRRIRGNEIGMIFQEPMSALDPVFTIGEQIMETLRAHRKIGAREAREQAIEALAQVGIPAPERRVDEYPHQLSGGMRQRAMIAIALVCNPRLLIADEPTTALDVTIQAQVIDLLLKLSESKGTALLFITHDLGVVAETCTRVLTMYAGQVVEDAPVEQALLRPRHPYTSGLLRSMPRLSPRKSMLPSVPGRVPRLSEMPAGCRFAARCSHAAEICHAPQELADCEGDRRVRCVRHAEFELPGAIA